MPHREAAPEVAALTRPEQLLVRRLKSGLTQEQVAEVYRVPARRYAGWERGEQLVPYRYHGRAILTAHERQVRDLSDHLQCVILRRRLGLTQAQVGQRMRRSRWWVNHAESGASEAAASELKKWILGRTLRRP